MAGMFRGGHARPTFDTPVEFISVNQTATDKSGGYGSPQTVRGSWGHPYFMPTSPLADRNDFEPTGDSGVEATSVGIFAWYTEGGLRTLLYTSNDNQSPLVKIGSNNFSSLINEYLIYDTNRNRNPFPQPRIISVDTSVSQNLPGFIRNNLERFGILIDDKNSQSLYFCRETPAHCEHYRRAIDDGLGPASRTFMADAKDIAGAERVVGDQTVAVSTKSLVFAAATLAPLLAEGSLAKDWKVRIGGRDMDIVSVMDGWVPNRYARLIVEERS